MIQIDSLEQLTELFIAASRRGEQPDVEDYARHYPQWSREIRELFPTALLMEQFKQRSRFGRLRAQGVQLGSGVYRKLGDFRLIRELGRGGMGVVYEAVQESLQRVVAVKVLRDAFLSGDEQAERFQREAQSAAQLHHTNIVPVFGRGQHEDVHYYVMQLIRGISLDEVITIWRQRGSLPQWEAVSTDRGARGQEPPATGEPDTAPGADGRISPSTTANSGTRRETAGGAPPSAWEPPAEQAPSDLVDPLQLLQRTLGLTRNWTAVAVVGRQVADGLQYAHSQGTMHRDIKPGNLIVDESGTTWITDFGLAKSIDQDRLTHRGDAVGTLRYMAPEQLEGQGTINSDVYGLGATLYELATLEPVFTAENRVQLIQKILREDPVPPLKRAPEIPRDLETIILKCLARNPADRYPHAREVAADLERFLDDRPIQARRVRPAERFWRWCRRNPLIAVPTMATAFLLLLTTTLATVGYMQVKAALEGKAAAHRRAAAEWQRAERNLSQAQANHQRAETHLSRAEAYLNLSLDALETVFHRFSRSPGYHSLEPPATSGIDQFESKYDPVARAEDVVLLQTMLEFYDRFAEQNQDNVRLQSDAARAYRRVGDIQKQLGDFGAARHAYQKALSIYQRHLDDAQPPDRARNPGGPAAQLAMARIKNDLGFLLKMEGNGSGAEVCHLDALQLLNSQLEHAHDPTEWQLELVRTHNLLGFAIWGRRQYHPTSDAPTLITAAEKNHRAALAMLAKLVEQDAENPEYQLMLARSYRDLSPVLYCKRQHQEGRTAYLKSITILDRLVEQFPTVPLYKYELMRVLSRWNSFRSRDQDRDRDENDPQEVELRYRRAIRLAEELASAYPTVAEYSARAAYNQFKLACFYRWSDRGPEALERFRSAIALHEKQVARYPHVPLYRLYLALAQYSVAEMSFEQGEFSSAIELATQSLAHLDGQLESELPRHQHQFGHRLYAKQLTLLIACREQLGLDAAEFRTRLESLGDPHPAGPSGCR